MLDRLDVIAVQYKRKTPIRDLTFQEEFRAEVSQLRVVADKVQDYWQGARQSYYGGDGKDKFSQGSRMQIKQIRMEALSLNRQSDELYTIYKNLHTIGKDLPLRLNWWLLDSVVADLNKVNNNILFLLRNMESRYE